MINLHVWPNKLATIASCDEVAELVSGASIAESGPVEEISKLMKEISAKAEGDYNYMLPRPPPHQPQKKTFFTLQ